MDVFWLVTLWVDLIGVGQAPMPLTTLHQVDRANTKLHGRLLDFTNNHGADRRIWSPALGQKRDLYVYLPPGFDPCKKYPFSLVLHGAAQDERFFLQSQVIHFDRAIAEGRLPPIILVAPDGSMKGRVTLLRPATFWCNSKAGNFEDYVMHDVWNFVTCNFPVRKEREAHAIVGASMGGSASFALAIKHRDRVKVAMGFVPLLNLRYVDCHGHYRAPFDPDCAGLRERFHGFEALGRRRLITLRFNDLFVPLFGHGMAGIAGMSAINPLELMERTDLRDGELDLYAAYAGKDEFNVAAQVESFLHAACARGIHVDVGYDPNGGHDTATGLRLMPAALRWAAQRMPVAQ